jgi:hypothetical protein
MIDGKPETMTRDDLVAFLESSPRNDVIDISDTLF